MEDIIVAFAKDAARRQILQLLEREGLTASYCCADGASTVRAVRRQGGGMVVCGFRLRDMTAEALRQRLEGLARLLVLAHAGDLALCGDGICKLPMPFYPSDFHAALELLLRKAPPVPGRRTEAERDAVRQAKALLMDVHRMSEPEAHRFLQQYSMDYGLKLAGAAQAILERYTK